MSDIQVQPKRTTPPPAKAGKAPPAPRPRQDAQPAAQRKQADGASFSPEAKSKQPPSQERTELMNGLKSNYGGDGRLSNDEGKLKDLSVGQLKALKKTREFDEALTKHENDHHEVAADLARSKPLYETKIGEDGQEYRTKGKVMIDVSVDKDPKKTVKKMRQVRAAALAPDGNQLAPLSEQDKKVAREAEEKEQKAQAMIDGRGNASEWAQEVGKSQDSRF